MEIKEEKEQIEQEKETEINSVKEMYQQEIVKTIQE